MHSHCKSCLRHAFPIYAMPLLLVANPRGAFPLQSNSSHFEAIPLLNCATQCSSFALPSKPCQSFAKMFQDMQCLCGSARFTARPCFPVHGLTLLFLCHSTPRLRFSSLCLASRFLCSSSPINSFPLPVNSLRRCSLASHCIAQPILCRSTLGYALPLLCCPAHCLAILCFALARLIRRLRPRGSGPCRSYATDQGHGNIRSPATRVPVSGPFHPYR